MSYRLLFVLKGNIGSWLNCLATTNIKVCSKGFRKSYEMCLNFRSNCGMTPIGGHKFIVVPYAINIRPRRGQIVNCIEHQHNIQLKPLIKKLPKEF